MNGNYWNTVNFSMAAILSKENLEKRGQYDLVGSTLMPIKGDWEVLLRWGIRKGDPVDDLFCECALPEGWKKAPFKHLMWVDLVDFRGLTRAYIFYKPGDRKAHFHTIQRFSVTRLSVLNAPWKGTQRYSEQGLVRDDGSSRTVYRDTEVCVAELDGELVAVKDDLVYCFCCKTQKLQVNTEIRADEAVLLRRCDFANKYSYIDDYHFVNAVEELAELNCRLFLKKLPTDDTVWGSEFDLSEV